jgi:hypothetical protein
VKVRRSEHSLKNFSPPRLTTLAATFLELASVLHAFSLALEKASGRPRTLPSLFLEIVATCGFALDRVVVTTMRSNIKSRD